MTDLDTSSRKLAASRRNSHDKRSTVQHGEKEGILRKGELIERNLVVKVRQTGEDRSVL